MAFLAIDVGRQLLGIEGFKEWIDQQLEQSIDFNRSWEERGDGPASGSAPSV